MRLLKKRLYLLAPLAIIVLAVFTLACESATQQAQGDGQILRMRLDGEPETIDPSTAQFGPSLGVARNLFATALRLDPVNGEVEPYVAREVPSKENKGISQDGLTYTFKLNSEAVWEDGRPLTSQDFVYSLRRLLDPRVASYYGQSYFAGVIAGSGELAAATGADPATIERLKGQLGMRAVDDHTLEIKLSSPSSTFNLLMTLPATAALRQDIVEADGDISSSKWTEAGRLLASGPFRLAEWTHGSRIVLESNPNFWNKGMQPKLQRVVLEIIESETTALSAYQAGNLEVAPVPIPSLRSMESDKELRRVAQASTFAIAFNNSSPLLDEPNERRAFCQSINREVFVSEINQGLGRPTTSWLPPSLTPYFDPQTGKSIAFSKDAGLLLGSDKGRYSSLRLSFAAVGPNQTRAEFLQGQWQQNLGVSVKLEPLDPPAFGRAFGTGNFELVFVGFGEDYHHPENWLLQWKSEMNPVGYDNPQFNQTVDEATRAQDEATAVRLWRQAERILVDQDVGICPLINRESAFVVKSYVKDFITTGADAIPNEYYLWRSSIDR